jgi:hypothetical protein
MLKKRYFEQNTRTFVKKNKKLKIKNLKALMLKKIRKNENKR